MSDGTLALFSNYVWYGPFGVRACVSSDCGQTWDLANEVILRMDGGTPGQAGC